jgi:beta-xylosidase
MRQLWYFVRRAAVSATEARRHRVDARISLIFCAFVSLWPIFFLLTGTPLAAQVRDLGPAVIMNGDFGDPSIVRDGDDFYMVHSTGGIPAFRFWHSKDLHHWQPIAAALERSYGPWAAELIKYKDLFYLYDYGGGANWVMTAKDPRGPWTAPVDLKLKGIDPGHIATPEGKRYLYVSKGMAVELAEDGLSALGPQRTVYTGWDYADDWVVECLCLESPKLVFRDGYYYMVSAQGGTVGPSTSHMAVVARAKSPLGPWTNSPFNPLIKTWSRSEAWWSKGHGMLIDDGHGQWFIVYHALENNARRKGRQTLIEPIDWKDRWPVRRYPDGMKFRPQVIRNWEVRSDDFTGNRLNLQWQLHGMDSLEGTRVTDGKFYLTASPKDMRMLAVKVSDLEFETEIKFDVQGEVEAGLVLAHRSGYLGIGWKDGQIRNPTGSSYRYSDEIDCPDCRCLKYRLKDNEITAYYSADGVAWKKYPRSYDIDLFTGFGGLKIGIYALGTGNLGVDSFTYRR